MHDEFLIHKPVNEIKLPTEPSYFSYDPEDQTYMFGSQIFNYKRIEDQADLKSVESNMSYYFNENIKRC